MNSKRKWCQVGKAVGVLLMLGPVFSFLGTAFEIWRAFALMGTQGITDPRLLSSAVHGALVVTALGITVLPVGVIIFLVSVRCDRQLRLSAPPVLPPQVA